MRSTGLALLLLLSSCVVDPPVDDCAEGRRHAEDRAAYGLDCDCAPAPSWSDDPESWQECCLEDC